MPHGYIYEIVNHANNKVYIGQTRQHPNTRWTEHKYTARQTCKHASAIHSAIRKYGLDVFTFEVLAEAQTQDELNRLERTYIEGLNSLTPNGYNLTSGGESPRMSDVTRDKLSKAMKGKPSPNKGKPMSEETKKKLSAARQGIQSTKRKMVIDSDGFIFDSVSLAAKANNTTTALIIYRIKTKSGGRNGLHFNYLT